MEYKSINLPLLLDYLQKRYPDIKFEIKDDEVVGKLSKDVTTTYSIGTTEDLITWRCPILVHVNVQQSKNLVQGFGCAVDCSEDLEIQSDYAVLKGKEWAGIVNKEIRKKLI